MPATSAKAEYQTDNVDPALENGPLAKRQCRDVLCCLLFIIFMAGMVGIGIWGYTQGNPRLIGRGYDSDGKMCGVDEGYEDYPYLYFPIPFTGYLTRTVCLSACPSTDPLPSTLNSECKTTSYHANCNANPSSTGFQNMMDDYTLKAGNVDGQFYIYETTGYVSRFCVPQKVGETLAASNTILNSDLLEKWISDIRETWPVIAISIAVAFIIGFVYMVLLRYCSGVLTWLAIFAFIVGTAILGWRFYDNAQKIDEETESTGSENNSESSAYKTVMAQKVIAYICWGVAGLTFLAVLCLFSRIRLAIAIMKAAADYVKDTPSVFLVPPVIVIFLLIFYAFWGGAAIFLISSGDTEQISGTPFGTFSFDKRLQRLLIYHLFGLLWFNAFVLASTQFILASSTALWYFSQGTGQAAPKTIRTSISRLFKYHFGSIAFGSLILAIVQMIRLVLAYMEAQANKMQGKENRLIKYTLRCLSCYVACFERFIKFLNKNAYIQIALTGKGFCGAAKDAFMLIAKNPLRLGVVSSIGGIFVLFGKIFVAAITALIAFLVLTNWDQYSTKIYSPLIPTLVVFIFSYVVGAIFMTVYGLAADTILACFIVDESLSGNAPARHCPSSLREFLNRHDKRNKN